MLSSSGGSSPTIDEGGHVIDYAAKPGTSLTETDRGLLVAESIIRSIPEIESYSRRTGAALGEFVVEPNTGDFAVKLRPNRARKTDEVIAELGSTLAHHLAYGGTLIASGILADKRDLIAAKRTDIGLNRLQLDPFLKGKYPFDDFPLIKTFTRGLIKPGDTEKMCCLDLLGLNYYSRAVVKYDFKAPLIQAAPVQPVGNEYSSMWEIFPEGIHEMLTRVWKDYQPTAEIMITENGVPVPDGLDYDGRCRDERRIRYLQSHITQVRRAMDEGVPVKGYFHWSLMDNFEWALGYAPRFGLIYVDYKTLKRTIKDSGRWFAKVIQESGFEY